MHNGADGVEDVRRKLSDFQRMLDVIRQYADENILYLVKEKFWSCSIFGDGKTIADFISDYDNTVKVYGKDVYTLFQGILKHCKESKITLGDMKEYLDMEDENSCSGIVVLNTLDGYETHIQVMSNVNGWLNFRRHFLAKYPQNGDFFITESKKYFPGLFIHNDSKSKINDVLMSHVFRIVEYLTVLNDCLIEDFKKQGGRDLIAFLPYFACKHSLDGASFEGCKDEEKFTFMFPDGTNAYCEPHLKMYKDDAGNDNQHCRIYFKKPHEGDTKVYVGCICKHL